MKGESFQGKRYIGFVRSATGDSADERKQLESIKAFGEQHKVLHVQDVILESGADLKKQLHALVARKKDADDFDILVVQDNSRLGRGGPVEMSALFQQFRVAGVRVLNS